MSISHKVVIVGGGAAGIATAASLLARRKGLDIAIIDVENNAVGGLDAIRQLPLPVY